MSAKDQMRAMLDQLMGSSRNGEANTIAYSDPKVCRAFLLSCCPFTVLAETRLELGDCSKMHQLSLRPDYEAAQRKEDHFYDVEACTQLAAFIGEWDRKIEGFKRKLCSNQEALSEEVTGKVTKVQELSEKIQFKLEEAEKMGTEGMVEESMTIMEEVETLQAEKSLAEQDYNSSLPDLNIQQQKLRVCEVCSAYLGIHEIDRSLADHFGGKLHLGFKELRDRLAEMQKTISERKELQRETERKKFDQIREETNTKLLLLSQKEESRSKTEKSSRGRRDRSRSKGNSRRRSRSRSRSRNKKDRNKHRHRSRSSSRHRRRSKERSRSRNRKNRRSRSRGRYRSKSKSSNRKRRGSRSRSSERKDKKKNSERGGRRSSKSSERGGSSTKQGAKQHGSRSRSRSSHPVRNDKDVPSAVKSEPETVKKEKVSNDDFNEHDERREPIDSVKKCIKDDFDNQDGNKELTASVKNENPA